MHQSTAKPLTSVPKVPLASLPVIFMREKEAFSTLVRLMLSPVMFVMVPPVSLRADPIASHCSMAVLVSEIPLTAPSVPAEILWNARAPPVSLRETAVPVVVVTAHTVGDDHARDGAGGTGGIVGIGDTRARPRSRRRASSRSRWLASAMVPVTVGFPVAPTRQAVQHERRPLPPQRLAGVEHNTTRGVTAALVCTKMVLPFGQGGGSPPRSA